MKNFAGWKVKTPFFPVPPSIRAAHLFEGDIAALSFRIDSMRRSCRERSAKCPKNVPWLSFSVGGGQIRIERFLEQLMQQPEDDRGEQEFR